MIKSDQIFTSSAKPASFKMSLLVPLPSDSGRCEPPKDQPGILRTRTGRKIARGPCVGGSHYDEQVCSGEIEKTGKQNDSWAVEVGGAKEVEAVRRRQVWSMVLPQSGCVWPTMTHVTTKGHRDAQCLGLPIVFI